MSGVKMKNTASGPWRSGFTYLYKYATTSERCQNEPWTLRMLSTDWAGRRKCQGFTSLTFSTGINNINSYYIGKLVYLGIVRGQAQLRNMHMRQNGYNSHMGQNSVAILHYMESVIWRENVAVFLVKACYTLYFFVLIFCWHLLLHEIIYSMFSEFFQQTPTVVAGCICPAKVFTKDIAN